LNSPEIRIDQLTGLRTILAPGRADRPHRFEPVGSEDKGAEGCPFCEGQEERTPPEVYAARPSGGAADTPGWTSRVVPNLYPALGEGGEPHSDSAPELFGSRPAVGSHEVIVHAPEHVTAMAELSEERFAGAIATWRERLRAHSDAAYSQLVVNEGAGAGASLPHTHAQLYALGFVPALVARERERAGAYAERTSGRDLLGDVLVEEMRRRERLVAIDDEAALICPWASRSPYELRVVPRGEAPRFEQDSGGAAMLRLALQLLAKRFDGSPELNLWVRTAPRGVERFRWHIDIAPRLTIKAGFELGTGVDINIYPPERAAADLRELPATA
jgi:UDPglucose--hexose-1-phosphate uridylyltransferase